MIYIFVPAVLITLLFVVAAIFPLAGKEFAIVQKEIARRKGEDSSTITEEEKQICEKVTGFAYDNLWNPRNANRFSK